MSSAQSLTPYPTAANSHTHYIQVYSTVLPATTLTSKLVIALYVLAGEV